MGGVASTVAAVAVGKKVLKEVGEELASQNPGAPALSGPGDPTAPPSLEDAEAREAALRRRMELLSRRGHGASILTGPGGVTQNAGVVSTLLGG